MGVLLALGMLGMILDGRTAMQGAGQGVELCLTAVIPSLLPFLCLSMLLTARLMGRKLRILSPIGKLFGLPMGAESLLIPALLGGYPAGAACVAQAVHREQLTRRDGEILLGFCNLPGPAFLFGIAAGQFSHPLAGAALWLCALFGAWAASRLLPKRGDTAQAEGVSGPDPLGQAGAAMGKICVTVILFRTMLNFLDTYLHLDGPLQAAAAGFLELTNGCCALRNVPTESARFLLAAGMVSFGGVCVGMQTAFVCPGLGLRYYWLGKLLQTFFSVLLGWLLLRKALLFSGILIAALIFLPQKVAFCRGRMYNKPKHPSGRKLCFSERK